MLFGFLLLVSSCTDPNSVGSTSRVCAPGSTHICDCGPSVEGVQVCGDDGTFDLCQCADSQSPLDVGFNYADATTSTAVDGFNFDFDFSGTTTSTALGD